MVLLVFTKVSLEKLAPIFSLNSRCEDFGVRFVVLTLIQSEGGVLYGRFIFQFFKLLRLLERAELDDRACAMLERVVGFLSELLDFPKLIITVLIGFPDRVASVTNGIAIVRVVPRCFVRPSPKVAAM